MTSNTDVNNLVCDGLVGTVEAFDLFYNLAENEEEALSLIDPLGMMGSGRDAWTEESTYDAEYADGLEGAIANCRDLWDENEVAEPYCCQMFGMSYPEDPDVPDGPRTDFNLGGEVVIGSTTTLDGPGELFVPYLFEDVELSEWVVFAAETFKSAKALAGAMATVAATAMVFTC